MFYDNQLQNHLETASSLKIDSAVIAEWNMNFAENIEKVGNYRFRPGYETPSSVKYGIINNTYDPQDNGYFYTDATDADVMIDGGYEDENTKGTPFKTVKEKEKMLFSLEDCFGRFRPRSGINKLRFFKNTYTHTSNINMARRPRYYMAHKNDKFKYWCSFRTASLIGELPAGQEIPSTSYERGIANRTVNGKHYIDDAVPFVVYKDSVPANRLVIKMQTHIGDIDLGSFTNSSGNYDDPFYGEENKRTPARWSIQYLEDKSWTTAISFNENTTRPDGSPLIGPDGYLELQYGLIVPEQLRDIFLNVGSYTSETLLPTRSTNGYGYFVKSNSETRGKFYVWLDNLDGYYEFVPQYGWAPYAQEVGTNSSFVTDFTNPDYFVESGKTVYREFDYINGVRIVIETMNKEGSTFDLIEMSPRLAADITERTTSFNIKKPASDLGVSGMPVGDLLVSTGNIEIFDFDDAFNEANTNSIIGKYSNHNLQIKFYEQVKDVPQVDGNGDVVGFASYFIPMKTMYADGFPSVNSGDRTVKIELRDMFIKFESTIAPEIVIRNASVSYAISLLLDNIGFSNYIFKRNADEKEVTIPFFFIPPNTSVAEVLKSIAISTQTAMFFDEYNNFVMMSKNYIMPTVEERSTDMTLIGTNDQEKSGIVKNKLINGRTKLANIIQLASEENKIYNNGNITYTTRYIQKERNFLTNPSIMEKDYSWKYKPVLLWQVTPENSRISYNDELATESSYALAAVALKSDLSAEVPTVVNNVLQNNVMDLGESVSNLLRYSGYFYANGEIIRYDAIEYSITGNETGDASRSSSYNVWIADVQDYQREFSKLKFNGKMYPTGLVRIYAEPFYETDASNPSIVKLKNGPVAKHGRSQFATGVKDSSGNFVPVSHQAGLDPYWKEESTIAGCEMQSQYMFTQSKFTGPTTNGIAGKIVTPGSNQETNVDQLAKKGARRTGILKNYQGTPNKLVEENSYKQEIPGSGLVQSSAFVLSGPNNFSEWTVKPINFISYAYKTLTNKFTHFGTRIRIAGTIENSADKIQTAIGSSTYYDILNGSKQEALNVSGGSGGLGVLVNPDTNSGYYFELVALSQENSLKDANNEPISLSDMFFYKIKKDSANANAIPVVLWEGVGNIVIGDDNFVNAGRVTETSVLPDYDISVEYKQLGSALRFYLYVNGRLLTTVDDPNPETDEAGNVKLYNNVAMFVRGTAKCIFQNIYALGNNYSDNTMQKIDTPVNSVFGDTEINVSEALSKYALNGFVQSVYLSSINPNTPPKENIYFEEFGTIMREAAYFDIKYEKAYPSFRSLILPTFNRVKSYVTSSFMPTAYGAEFIIFNATDSTISLADDSENYLQISGITFTQATQNQLSVDQYFNKKGELSNPTYVTSTTVESPLKIKESFNDIKFSRQKYGMLEFSLDAPYIQSHDDAYDLMGWLLSKVTSPRKAIGIDLFGMPTIQLGDIVEVDYTNKDSNEVVSSSSRFVVYNIEYSKSVEGPSMTVYLSEVM
jgi:hypothetical protein